jgi:hypothetical protein
MQSQQLQPPRSDSPSNIINNTALHHNVNHLKSAPDSIFNPQNTHLNMYNNIHTQPEYSDLEGQKPKVDGFGSASVGPYRTTTAFNAFSNTRMRHQHTPGSSVQYREAPQSTFNHSYPTVADVFPVQQMTSPTLQQQQSSSASHVFDVHQGRGFDFGAGNGSQSSAAAPLSSHNKPSQYSVDPYGASHSSSALLQSHQVGGIMKPVGTNQSMALSGLASQHQQTLDGYQHHQSQTYLNGLHLQSQTPYGPHLQTNGPGSTGAGSTNGQGPAPSNATAMNHMTGANNGASQSNSQEEISTIFVVGFPEDMQVCISQMEDGV